MHQIERLECGRREYFEERDHGGNEFVLLFDHNKRTFIGYDGDEEDFFLPVVDWLDKPIEQVISKGAALQICLKSREALESGRIVEYSDVVIIVKADLASYCKVRVIPDGPGMCLLHVQVIGVFSIN